MGKTTLARMLREHLDAGLLLEVFEENPFLSKFYVSRTRYAFQTQMFFLLSRYRQQQQVNQLLRHDSLIADYMFAKDRLFAQLNLAGDEWEIYQQIHGALAEQVSAPQLIVYLQANTDVLMARIAQRDRPYERDMKREYIEALRQAYEHFFADYKDTPVLFVDSNPLNFVTNPADLQAIAGRIHHALREGMSPRPSPRFEATADETELLARGHPVADFQRFHDEFDKTKGFITDVYFNYLCLTEEIGELGSELAEIWRVEAGRAMQGLPAERARENAIKEHRLELGSELADCMAYLLKLANYTGVDLETAYLEKMGSNRKRTWK